MGVKTRDSVKTRDNTLYSDEECKRRKRDENRGNY
jgi:hypothetical protein